MPESGDRRRSSLDKETCSRRCWTLLAGREHRSSAVRTTGCIFRARCSTSRCRRRTATRCELCVAQCDVLMQRNEQRRGITAVVRSKLFRESGAFPDAARRGGRADVHPRTLRRQLAEEDTSFRALLNEARSTLGASDLLCNVGLTVEEVVKAIGLHRHLDVLPRVQTVARSPAERVSAHRLGASATGRRPWRRRSSRWPACRIRPASMSRCTRSTLDFDHALRGFRGLNR